MSSCYDEPQRSANHDNVIIVADIPIDLCATMRYLMSIEGTNQTRSGGRSFNGNGEPPERASDRSKTLPLYRAALTMERDYEISRTHD